MTTPMRRQSPKSRDEEVESLAALLDHLGRLLAEEYVAILMSARPTEVDPREER
jgi:hypothetical protein